MSGKKVCSKNFGYEAISFVLKQFLKMISIIQIVSESELPFTK